LQKKKGIAEGRGWSKEGWERANLRLASGGSLLQRARWAEGAGKGGLLYKRGTAVLLKKRMGKRGCVGRQGFTMEKKGPGKTGKKSFFTL